MARPLQTGKQSVTLASSGVRVSRIRRDPPPVVKEKSLRSRAERDKWDVVIGIVAFALSLFVIIFAFGSYSGWSLGQYTVELRASE